MCDCVLIDMRKLWSIHWLTDSFCQSSAKCHYLQIPTTAKNLTLPSKSNTCKFQDSRFTAKIHYLYIQLLTNSYNPSTMRFTINPRLCAVRYLTIAALCNTRTEISIILAVFNCCQSLSSRNVLLQCIIKWDTAERSFGRGIDNENRRNLGRGTAAVA